MKNLKTFEQFINEDSAEGLRLTENLKDTLKYWQDRKKSKAKKGDSYPADQSGFAEDGGKEIAKFFNVKNIKDLKSTDSEAGDTSEYDGKYQDVSGKFPKLSKLIAGDIGYDKRTKVLKVGDHGIEAYFFVGEGTKTEIYVDGELVKESKLNEGQFSWMTQDTGQQIGSERQNRITVYMYDNEGNSWEEKGYDGYGEFGGKDFYDLVSTMNGYPEDRQTGIDLAFEKIKTKDKGRKTLFPALVTNKRYNWKNHDFTTEPDNDPNQSWWFDEEEYNY
jgi:hypothetical protein